METKTTLKKPTISEFVAFVERSKRACEKPARTGQIESTQTMFYTETEVLAIYFLLLRHGFDSLRHKVREMHNKIDDKEPLDSDILLDKFTFYKNKTRIR